jgi:L-ascorbate metabolism protein UlaG (beta-lactamase superfamily)
MELQFFGANCVRIVTRHANVVVDDNLKALGLSSVAKAGDVVLYTHNMVKQGAKEPKIVIDQPGEFEVSAISIQGIAARAHMDDEKAQTATIFKVIANDVRVAIVGHIFADLSDDQLEAIGTIDVLVIPVGNSGYTLDGIGALKVIKKIEPKIIIPTHYADSKIKYEVPQTELSEALKNMSMEAGESVPKLKLKHGELPENMQLVVLERQ